MALNGAGWSITMNSTILLTSPAVTASSIDPMEYVVSPAKPMSGVHSCLRRVLVNPILLKAS